MQPWQVKFTDSFHACVISSLNFNFGLCESPWKWELNILHISQYCQLGLGGVGCARKYSVASSAVACGQLQMYFKCEYLLNEIQYLSINHFNFAVEFSMHF